MSRTDTSPPPRAAPPRYRLGGWLFLRLLGLVALIAFVSLGTQLEGLVGADGLLPADDYFERLDAFFASEQAVEQGVSRWDVPTLSWLVPGDAARTWMIWIGAAASLLVLVGVAEGPLLLLAWMLYLSLVVAGQTFLSFQWDSLLLETLVCALFVARWPGPVWRARFWRSWRTGAWRPIGPSAARDPWWVGLDLLRFLLFKLMFLSGAVKLLSLDTTWWQLTALDVHYMTQPIPTWTSWWAHQFPGWFQAASVAVMFVVELVLPFFVFGGRLPRRIAFAGLVGLQLLIAATGNYGFFNLLTIVLCVPLLDDRLLAPIADKLPAWVRDLGVTDEAEPPRRWTLGRRLGAALACALLLVSA